MFVTRFVVAIFTLISFVTARAVPFNRRYAPVRRAVSVPNYTTSFSSQFAVVNSTVDFISRSDIMSSFNPATCATTCDSNTNCAFFNIYVTNSPSSGVYCAFYSAKKVATDAVQKLAPNGLPNQGVHQSYGYSKNAKVADPYSSNASLQYTSMSTAPLTSSTAGVYLSSTQGSSEDASPLSTSSPTASDCAFPTSLYSEWCGSEWEGIADNAVLAKLSNIKTKNFILPLYMYPAFWTTPGTWDWVVSAIKSQPKVAFTIIINPTDGPGTDTYQAPPADYVTGIKALRAAGKNVKIIGYIDTNNGVRNKNDVLGDIKVYASWGSSKPDGVFFDRQATSASKYSLYQSYVKQARTSFGSSSIVGSNPAGICDVKYIGLFDFTTIYDDSADNLEATIFGDDYESFLASVPESQYKKLAWFITEATTESAKSAILNLQVGVEAGLFYVSDQQADLAPMEQVDGDVLAAALTQIATPTF